MAQQFISNHTYNTILVVGADKLSSIVNWTDRNTCVLFGDGAGAAVLRWRAGSHGVITTFMGSDGNFGEILHMPGGGCAIPAGEISSNPALIAGTDPVPKVSVAGARCPQSYQIQNQRQGTFHREIVC